MTPEENLVDTLIGIRCDDTPEELLSTALDMGIIPDIVYRGKNDTWVRDEVA